MASTNLRYYRSIFMRRLPYFLLVATVIGAASIIMAMTLPPSFVSRMTLIVESPQIPDELAASTARTPAQEQLQVVEQRLMTRANLLEIANKLQVLEKQNEMTPDQIAKSMRARTVIRSTAGRDQAALMTISFEAPSGQKSAGVLNEYLTLIQKEDVQSRTGRATQTLEFFEQEVSRLNQELAERSARILAYKTEHGDALPESLDYRLGQQSLLQERLAQLERESISLQEQRRRLVRIFETTGQVGGLAGPALSPEQQQLEEMRAALNNALAVYSETNPRVKILRARIEALEKTLQSMPPEENDQPLTGNSLLDVQLAEITARENSLNEQKRSTQKQLEKLADTIERTPSNSIRLDELQLEYANVQLQYNTAVERLSRASTGERIEVMSRGQRISVIEPPAVPNQPSKPNRALIAGGGSVFGIMAGIGLIVLLEFMNRSIRRPEDLVAKLGITPLATIPFIATAGENSHRQKFRILGMVIILLGVPLAVYAVHMFYQPLDLLAERIMDKIGVRW
ncbi:lipopolysaccharide biosynthesis [Aliiroseovarius sp. S1339]|uniref:GumC family protein n=1 Tax=Aliiroseovarius sp. S1339 TaxID=2936990 RepID=UPI0020C1225B|nr:lipopolysaccharide biosynthesis [Aliiroseovarius sp. S1339]MCK8465152.1 lipopolysaccharide biosynthesis [Aliiroseovarius sp. S1339]